MKLDGYPALRQEALEIRSVRTTQNGVRAHLLVAASVAALGLRSGNQVRVGSIDINMIYLDVRDVEVPVNKLLVEVGEATGDCGYKSMKEGSQDGLTLGQRNR